MTSFCLNFSGYSKYVYILFLTSLYSLLPTPYPLPHPTTPLSTLERVRERRHRVRETESKRERRARGEREESERRARGE
jgi:hypothetical protein